MRDSLLRALDAKVTGDLSAALADLEVLLRSAGGVADHSGYMNTLLLAVDQVALHAGRMDALELLGDDAEADPDPGEQLPNLVNFK